MDRHSGIGCNGGKTTTCALSFLAWAALLIVCSSRIWPCSGGEDPPFLYVGDAEDYVNVTGTILYVAYDPQKSTLGDYRAELGIEATGALDVDYFYEYEQGWQLSDEEDDTTTLSEWTTDDDAATTAGVYTCAYFWDDVADTGQVAGSREDGSYTASCTIVVVAVTTEWVYQTFSQSWSNSTYNGRGAADDLVDAFLAAFSDVYDRVQAIYEHRGDEGGYETFLQALLAAVSSFEDSCDNIQDAVANLNLSTNPSEAVPIEGVLQFRISAVPPEVGVPINVTPSVYHWKSTRSFGDTLWESITPTSFSVGDQLVTIVLNGNLGTVKINVAIGAPINRTDYLYSEEIDGFCEEDLALGIIQTFNVDKDRIEGRLQLLEAVNDALNIINGWIDAIPGLGDLVSAIINTATTVTRFALDSYLECEMDTAVDQACQALIELEDFPENSPSGGEENDDQSLRAALLEAGN